MSRIEFEELPDLARVWVFASGRPLSRDEAGKLLREVDDYLEGWKAHGLPLTAARDWRDDRFLAVAVDQTDAHASGCSVDGLHRSLQNLERDFTTSLLPGGNVFYRRTDGTIASVSRGEFETLAAKGEVGEETVVLDPTIETAGDWYSRFEVPAHRSWHRSLLPASEARRG